MVARHVAALDEDLLIEGNADRLARVRRDSARLAVPQDLMRGNAGDLLGRREQQRVADLEPPALHPPGDDPAFVELVDVLDRQSQRQIDRLHRQTAARRAPRVSVGPSCHAIFADGAAMLSPSRAETGTTVDVAGSRRRARQGDRPDRG